ncbi:CCHC-type domain-containing protein [Trichonephila clavipes]|nr:CCHC-type domain-containing protein [Trichonephila clavipes]
MGNAKRRVSAKRKRQFRGNGSTIKHLKNSSATSTNASSSKIKIPAAFDEEIAEYQRKPLTGNRIIDMEVLLNLFLQLCCPRCFEEGILLSEDSTYGLCSNFVIRFCVKNGSCWCYENLQRSIVKRGLKYAHYYGDGDSKGFITVKDTYGKDSVTKYECIGHVQKRVGARLRKLKSNNKNLSGKGKLTDSFIDRLQNYYGIAVRSKVGNLSGLQQNVIAALFHCSSSVEKPMHGQCPIGKDSSCYYQRALSCGKKPNEKYKGLSNEVLNTIKPTYLELCMKELLTKCLHGKTQNSNECLVFLEVFVCLKTLKSGALDAVIQFNDGYKVCVEIFKKLNIFPGYFTLKAYKHLDINRINDAERHSTPNVKQRRKILRATRKKNQCFRE